ncbi:MAG: hypothetical protein K6G18_06040 [Treponema sp.]|nr:hypothetical protein [Treponema sp.]
MILTDNEIRKLVSEGKLITENYRAESLKGIAYELTIDSVINADGKECASLELEPGQTVYVKGEETISIPNNLCGKVIQRNSVMRAGLSVDAPVYIPGHTTKTFLRVQNISDKVFSLHKGFPIAQIMFEKLSSVPSQTYDKQTGASFAEETNYKGLGGYTGEYTKLMKDIKEERENLDSLTERIYGNVLTLMGILVAVFSFITIDFNILAKSAESIKSVVVVNLSLALSISILMGIVLFFVNGRRKGKRTGLAYFILITVLAAATFAFAMFCPGA